MSTMTRDEYGVMRWHDHNGNYHRPDGPAYEYSDTKEWWLHGQLHRIDGPAITTIYVEKWFLLGRYHRIGGPAIVHSGTGQVFWYQHGKLHRLDGPAVEYPRYPHLNRFHIQGYEFNEEEYWKKVNEYTTNQLGWENR